MNGNKLLTGFLVLGMGFSLVACSSDKPESKKEEAKVAEKKKEEKRMDTQDRTAKLEYIKLDRDKSTFKSHRDFSSEKEITFKHL